MDVPGLGLSSFENMFSQWLDYTDLKELNKICKHRSLFDAYTEKFAEIGKSPTKKRVAALSRIIVQQKIISNFGISSILLPVIINNFFNINVNIASKHHSSGEQNMLVIIGQILDKSRITSLILIDEPEISMHIELQREFLKGLQGIRELFVQLGFKNFPALLITTHSPDIIFYHPELVNSIPPIGEE